MENINWEYKQFTALTSAELYNILTIRNEVFVVEQNCIYLDTDNKDQHAWHLLGYINEKLVAYSRILPPGVSFHEASIGRVVTHSTIRRNGIGNELSLGRIWYIEIELNKYIYPISLIVSHSKISDYDMIIGINFLKTYQSVIDFKKNFLILDQNYITLLND